MRLGKHDLAEQYSSRKRLRSSPGILTPTTIWARCMSGQDKLAKAAPYLEKAQQIDPSSYDNGYDLALAYVLTGRLGGRTATGSGAFETEKYRRAA